MSTRQEKKERITSQRKEQIMNAALTVFSKKGYGEATIPDIAQEAGIAVGTIYNYYEGKRDLLISLLGTMVVTEPFVRLIEYPPEADDAAFFSKVIEDRLDWGFEKLDKFFFLISEIQRDPELQQQYIEQILYPVMQLLENYLKSRIASQAFRNIDTRVMARALPAMMIGLIILSKIEGEKSPLKKMPRQELVAELTNLVLKGIQEK